MKDFLLEDTISDCDKIAINMNKKERPDNYPDDTIDKLHCTRLQNGNNRCLLMGIICVFFVLFAPVVNECYSLRNEIFAKNELIVKLTTQIEKHVANNEGKISVNDELVIKLTNENAKCAADNERKMCEKDALINKLTNETEKYKDDNEKKIYEKDGQINKLFDENAKCVSDNEKKMCEKDALIHKLTNENANKKADYTRNIFAKDLRINQLIDANAKCNAENQQNQLLIRDQQLKFEEQRTRHEFLQAQKQEER